MKTKIISLVISALMLFACSATAFADDPVGVTDAESATVTALTVEATDTDAAEVSTEENTETTTEKENEGVTVLREEVTLDNTEPAETEIVIDTSDVSIEEQKPENEIIVDYADTHTDIPNTGSSGDLAFFLSAMFAMLTIYILCLTKKYSFDKIN